MIDIHLHILPGVDDGPATIDESLALARALVDEGVHAAVATPHYNDEFPHLSADDVAQRVEALQRELDHHDIPLRVFPGHEVLIRPGLVEDVEARRVATLNGSRYLLLELYVSTWLPTTERVVFELLAHGITPIIAHPERYRAVQEDPGRLAKLIQQGALAQLTASSLVGAQGNTARRCAEGLLKRGLVQFIASDAHGMNRRAPHLLQGIDQARRLVGSDKARQIIDSGPTAIIIDGVALSRERS